MKRSPLRRKSKSITSIWQRKCDSRLQEKGRELYSKCEVCGKPMSCLHHFYPRRVSARLRYDWDNLIPICNGCHMRHHQAGDPKIHGTVIKKRGQAWYDILLSKSRESIKVDKFYYEYVWEMLNEEKEENIG